MRSAIQVPASGDRSSSRQAVVQAVYASLHWSADGRSASATSGNLATSCSGQGGHARTCEGCYNSIYGSTHKYLQLVQSEQPNTADARSRCWASPQSTTGVGLWNNLNDSTLKAGWQNAIGSQVELQASLEEGILQQANDLHAAST